MESTMSKTAITLENKELTKNQIIKLLEQLIIDEQNCIEEKKRIAIDFPTSEEDFTILEEIELLTTYIRGYASQIKAQGYINKKAKTVKNLQKIRVFNIPKISKFYFNNQLNFPLVKNYLQMLDYLRLLILEYLAIE